MLVTQSIQIRGLTAEQYEILRYQCRLAKNMYNVGLYSVRQFFFAENRFLAYESNYHHCKDNENYGLLHSQVAQQCLKSVDEAIRGFFKLLAQKKEGKLAARIALPHYLKKDGYFPLVYPQPYIKEGAIQFSVSNKFRKNYREKTGKAFKAFKFLIPHILKSCKESPTLEVGVVQSRLPTAYQKNTPRQSVILVGGYVKWYDKCKFLFILPI